jgi:uncharacterized protein (TIGR03435 family)
MLAVAGGVFPMYGQGQVATGGQGASGAGQGQVSQGAADTSKTAPSFEVTSVKMVSDAEAHGPNAVPTAPTYPTARFSMHNSTLVTIMVAAYGTDGRRVEKRPEWNEQQLYNVDATVEGGKELTRDQMQPLLQQLLEQRFHLKVHREIRPVQGYEMVVSPGGIKFETEDPKARPADMPTVFHGYVGPNELRAWGLTMERLAHMIVSPVGQPVVDKTGLTGAYDVDLKYRDSAEEDSSLPSVFTAVQEQLGLKLVPAKLQLDYLVIDHVQRVPEKN